MASQLLLQLLHFNQFYKWYDLDKIGLHSSGYPTFIGMPFDPSMSWVMALIMAMAILVTQTSGPSNGNQGDGNTPLQAAERTRNFSSET